MLEQKMLDKATADFLEVIRKILNCDNAIIDLEVLNIPEEKINALNNATGNEGHCFYMLKPGRNIKLRSYGDELPF